MIEESRLFTDPVIPGPKSKYVQYTSQFETAHFFSISIVNTVKEIFKTVTTSVIKNTMVKRLTMTTMVTTIANNHEFIDSTFGFDSLDSNFLYSGI